MPENNLSSAQVDILILDVADCGSTTTAVQKEVHDDPIPILAELTISVRLSQERQKFFVGVGFLDIRAFFDYNERHRSQNPCRPRDGGAIPAGRYGHIPVLRGIRRM